MPHLTAYTPKVFLRPSGIKDPAKILGKGCGGSLKMGTTMYSRIFFGLKLTQWDGVEHLPLAPSVGVPVRTEKNTNNCMVFPFCAICLTSPRRSNKSRCLLRGWKAVVSKRRWRLRRCALEEAAVAAARRRTAPPPRLLPLHPRRNRVPSKG